MIDVADLAGVSLKTVSRVINDEPHVSPALRGKVEDAIRRLDYVPDTAARSLGGGRTFTVGVLFDNPSPNYTMGIIEGAYRACLSSGYHLRIDHMDSSLEPALVRAQLDAIFRNSRTDGFVLTPPLTDEPMVLDHFDNLGVRYVRIAPADTSNRSPGVYIDDEEAGGRVAQYMWDLGHRSFGIVNGPSRHSASRRRRAGFLGRLVELAPQATVAEASGEFQFAGGIAGGARLLSHDDRPTAIFATNDDMAAGVMVACAQAGLTVPDDISVVGFDDSWVARSVWPYLTTVAQPIADMAATAVRLLLDRKRPVNGPELHKLDYHLVERSSVVAPPHGRGQG